MTAVRTLPGPKGHWFLGNLPDLRRNKLDFFMRCAREHGDMAAFRLGPHRCVLLSHPDLIEQVLVTDNHNFGKHFASHILRPVLGDGLLLSEGATWLRQRRLIQPAFLRQRIEAYGPIMVDQTLQLLATWKDGESRDLHAEMMHVALGIVSRTILGVETAEVTADVSTAVDLLLKDYARRFESFLPMPTWLPTRWRMQMWRAQARLEEIIHGFIQQRRSDPGDRDDLLTRLLRARDEEGHGMSDRQLRDEVMTLFLAGHETTANALSWTWYLLALHPEVEARLLAELREVLGGAPPTVADLPRLPYTEHVILESMRLYPPVYAFGRRALRRCNVGGHDIRADTTLFMSQWVVHRDPRFFDRPEVFDPDRWADGLARRIPKFAYFPFGGGPRVCIGNTFALIEVALIIATILPRFRFTLVPGHPVKPWPSVTLRPAQGVQAVVAVR
jgi:cytochrome P450